jgi:hypothetical protein
MNAPTLPPAKVQAYADSNGVPPSLVDTLGPTVCQLEAVLEAATRMGGPTDSERVAWLHALALDLAQRLVSDLK